MDGLHVFDTSMLDLVDGTTGRMRVCGLTMATDTYVEMRTLGLL